jgi:hypothetical protein
MKKMVFVFALFMVFSVSCEKEETVFPVSFYAPTIHGYMVTGDFGMPEDWVGIFDIKIGDPRLEALNLPYNNTIMLITWPNPCTHQIYLDIGGEGIMKRIWIVPAKPSEWLASYMDAVFKPVQGQPVFTLESDAKSMSIDLSNFDYQFFRIYVKIGDVLLWNNIVKQEIY